MSRERGRATRHPVAGSNRIFDPSSLSFRYEPHPIGLTRPAMPEDVHKELCRTSPPTELFTSLEKLGHEYVLSEKSNRPVYVVDVIRPIDPTRHYDKLNRKPGFDEVEVLETFPFRPNQVVIFTRTSRSRHCIRPLTGIESSLMRKTLTINIEEDD